MYKRQAVISGLLLVLGGVGYLYLTMTTVEEDAAGWAQALELAYAGITVLAGLCSIGLAKAQGVEMTSHSALLTLVPLLWSCLHLLVNYRMTCVDPKLPSFGFGLVDVYKRQWWWKPRRWRRSCAWTKTSRSRIDR